MTTDLHAWAADRFAVPESGTPPRPWWDQHRYGLLSAAVFLLMAAQTLRQQWSTDMWLHTASIREQIAHLWNPHNPILVARSPFPFFTPYTTAVAAVVKVLSLSPVTALQLAALVNVVLLLWAFQWFVIRLLGDNRVAFYALIFSLVLWGLGPWRTSGFLNLNSLGFGLPYPSAFTDGLAFVALGALVGYLRKGSRRDLSILIGAAALILTSHPLTGAWVATAAVALVISELAEIPPARLAGLGLAAVAVVVLTALWPMYSVFGLVSGTAFDASNQSSYHHILERTFPALPGLYFIWLRSRRRWRDPLGLMLVAGLILYVVGDLSHHTSYGRALIPIMLSLHLALATAAVTAEDWLRARHRWSDRNLIIALAAAMLLFVGLWGEAPGVAHILPTSLRPANKSQIDTEDVPGQFRFLSVVPADASVIAPPHTIASYAEPTFGGRLVWTAYSLPGPDTTAIGLDAERFFTGSAQLRERLIGKYHIEYIVANRAEAERVARQSKRAIIGCSSEWAVIDLVSHQPRDSSCYR